ncbi:hypothetical protein [Streptomyces sp. RTd22]|uniref:hypothetical protein n=1 Tax=Streptomyces sp. RTd22 TaxID=1841249 RepID=UPI0007C49F46|nr:hypothetical protein [Streptomyces sp. RTd22]
MTGPENYRKAEELAKLAARHTDSSDALVLAQLATAHATLALAAATAMGAPLDGEADSGLPQRDAEAWYKAAGVKPQPEGGADRG